jgi:hydroxyacyl-ACP dehydratase HTD2-like protein with hotdog domain
MVLARLLVNNKINRIARFEFRARSPLFVNQPIRFMGASRDEAIVTVPNGRR